MTSPVCIDQECPDQRNLHFHVNVRDKRHAILVARDETPTRRGHAADCAWCLVVTAEFFTDAG